ncbi:MAG: DEAD/DEAH box helicase [Verrucomicrobiota bacterium]
MLNPILFTERVVQDFLRYQLTAYPFADKSLYAQMRQLLNLEETRRSPLLKGPYVSLSRTFEEGIAVADAVKEGWLHAHLVQLISHPHLYGHQEQAIRAITDGRSTLVSTGTGSGKTECFLYPIISRCLTLRDQNAPPGISAVIVYPMNALADDQMDRLRELLAGTGIRFGIYNGSLKEYTKDAAGYRLSAGSSAEDYRKRLAKERNKPDGRDRQVIHPAEENISREEMRDPALRPRLLLTNVKQLELLLTRQKDIEMFDGALLDYLVFDEAHTFRGTMGAETACLIRRLRSYCGKTPEETVCVATSATIVDPKDYDSSVAGRLFASRFFGVIPGNVEIVGERYRPDVWVQEGLRKVPPVLNGNPGDHLEEVLRAVELDDEEAGREIARTLKLSLGLKLPEKEWRLRLYDELNANELLYQLVELLRGARGLEELSVKITEKVGRAVSEQEVLLWLALGAASRKEERPLVRPVIHTFVRGMGGAVVTFPPGKSEPKLYLSADTVEETAALKTKLKPLPVLSCTTCGQHYFEHWAKDFSFSGNQPSGGQAIDGDRQYWEACDLTNGGKRSVLLDRLIAQEDGDDGQPNRTETVWLCRVCGCLHSHQEPNCKSCGRPDVLTRIFAAQTRQEGDGRLGSCLCCNARGRMAFGSHREPARPVRAVTVSDVHVLAQNMLQHAERKRLLIFADNRQDAAFQAGWMQDHSRRYRLRALVYERLLEGAVSLGDLVAWLDERLDKDESLSKALAPEVWRAHRKAGATAEHYKARKFFLRAQVLRELTVGMRQRIGLEPWGRLSVDYTPLKPEAAFLTKWSEQLGMATDELQRGVELLLDRERRNAHLLLDRENQIFSRHWREGMREIQRGFLPLLPDVPKGLVLRRTTQHNVSRISQWLGKGNSIVRQAADKWGVPDVQRVEFVEELWEYLTKETHVLVETLLLNSRNEALPNCTGAHQIDSDLLRISASENRGVFRCKTCRQTVNRRPPHNKCLAYNCKGDVEWEPEREDNYDLQVLDGAFSMIRPKEHSAQVPQSDRTQVEQQFKGAGDAVNCLVCTPTLELGVDIGQLDSVLMRNVPPLPANYFQRAGRAGRRHRMAVNLTYARPASHDRAFFDAPEKLLNGVVLPPRFNLSNPVLVAHHSHAALLTALYSMAQTGNYGVTAEQQEEIQDVLKQTFPRQIGPFYFGADGNILDAPAKVAEFSALVQKYRDKLLTALRSAFNQGWPVEDAAVVTDEVLHGILDTSATQLQEIIDLIWDRLQWHIRQLNRLREQEAKQGALSDEEAAFWERCRRYVQKLKGNGFRARGTAEGFDDTNIYSVLAAEGWLPGYGLDTGSVIGSAIKSIASMSRDDFDLPRPSAMAVREYVPGNLIYANGERYTPRLFRLPPVDPVMFTVDVQTQSVREIDQAGGALGATTIKAMPICDVEMPHLSHISDEEEFRFQLPVVIAGMEQKRHDGGTAFKWGTTSILQRANLHMRLVNIGPQDRISQGIFGYPVCLVSGQSRSPYASQEELSNFRENQLERCGTAPEMALGLYADVVAHALKFQDMTDQVSAYSVGESLRLAGALVLDMEPDDLQLLVIPQAGDTKVDLIIYDPMPGGSGLLKQMIEAWPKLIDAAKHLVETCPGVCDSSCPDCLQRFRNAFYHRFLDRHVASAYFDAEGNAVTFSNAIPPLMPAMKGAGAEMPVNEAEAKLLAAILKAGLSEPTCQKVISLPKPFTSTTPDFFYEDPKEVTDGICIYLDGLSKHLHGNPATKQQDDAIRTILRDKNYAVLSIPASHLNDPVSLGAFLYNLARKLVTKSQAEDIRDGFDTQKSQEKDD